LRQRPGGWFLAALGSRKVASSDHDPLAETRRPDRQTLLQLLERHAPVVRQRLAGQIPRCWQSVLSVDDVMQQTYTDAFLDIDHFVPHSEGSFAAWLASLARCNLVDALRMLEADKRGQGRRPLEPRAADDSVAALCELLGSASATPSRQVARDEAHTALDRAVRQLPEAYRLVVEMYDLENRPVEEVARALGRSPGAVYMVRARAHRRLRELMGATSKYFSAS
jgi:RNA polymerase sigma-70 factor (ECF subfamily)